LEFKELCDQTKRITHKSKSHPDETKSSQVKYGWQYKQQTDSAAISSRYCYCRSCHEWWIVIIEPNSQIFVVIWYIWF